MLVANDAYVENAEAVQEPPPGFMIYCVDMGWGVFGNDTQSEVVFKAACKLQ